MRETPFKIVPVRSAIDLAAAVGLVRAYASSLDIDLAYQDFDAEMAAMPGKYAPPTGELLLARSGSGEALGCVGMRPMDEPAICEMKRLFVSPAARGLGVGKALVANIIHAAQQAGHGEMRLDTLPTMNAAVALYREAGFAEIDAYYDTPIAGTVFMSRKL